MTPSPDSRTTVLYVGSLRPGGNGRDRMQSLKSLGCDVLPFDTFPYIRSGTRPERSLAARMHVGRSVTRLNRDLSARAQDGGFDVVFVDKGVWIWPETLIALKAAANAHCAIHYTPDAQFLINRSRHFYAGLPQYDLAVTTKTFEVDRYEAAGAQNVLTIHQGFGGRLAPQPAADIPPELRSEVCFIGHCQPAYADILKHLSERVPLTIWGPNWTRYAKRHGWARGVVRGDGLYGPEYAQALSGSKIAIGLLNKNIPETTTSRTFEIPACGTMLLAERTEGHIKLYKEGEEAEFFASGEELCAKAEHYLADDEARRKIAAAGHARGLTGGYSAKAQLGRVTEWLENWLREKSKATADG